jgi:hypothetical protein
MSAIVSKEQVRVQGCEVEAIRMYASIIQPPLTFQGFLAWDNGPGRDFELRDGIPMPIVDPNAKHEDVADDLCDQLSQHCKTLDLLSNAMIDLFVSNVAVPNRKAV